MPKHNRFLFAMLCFSVMTLLVDSTSAAAFKRVHAGEHAPAFTLPDLDGNPVSLDDHREGPLTIVTFWALWSPKSEPLLADIQKILSEFEDKGLNVKAIAVNEDGENASSTFESEVRALIERNGLRYPIVVDKEMEQYAAWGVIATPSTAFLGKDLKVEYEFSGRPSSAYEDMRAEVMRILGVTEEVAETAKPKRERYEAPRAALLHYGLTHTLFERGQYSKARRKMKNVLSADPDFPDAHALSGAIHLGLFKEDGKAESEQAAREEFTKAVELDPTVPLGNAGMAYFALADGEIERASRFAREVVKYTEDEELPELADAGAQPAAGEAAEGMVTTNPEGDGEEQATDSETTDDTGGTAPTGAQESNRAAVAKAYLDRVDSLLGEGQTDEAKSMLSVFVDAYLNLDDGPSMTKKGMMMLKKME